jgi:hypothetical protein
MPEPPTTQHLSQIAARHGFGRETIRPMPATGMVNWIYALGETAVLRVSNSAHPDSVRDALTESVAVPAVRAAESVPRNCWSSTIPATLSRR